MNFQNALQQYFDGELDDVSEDLLFGELAHNYEARREFNEHTKLRAAMQQERSAITPPAHASAAIFGALGYDLPAPAPIGNPPVAGAIAANSGMFLKLLPYALTSLFSALVAVGIYAGASKNSFKNELPGNSTKLVVQEKVEAGFLKSENSGIQTSNENRIENSFKNEIPNRQNVGTSTQKIFKNSRKSVVTESEIPAEFDAENVEKKLIAVIASPDFKKENIPAQFLKTAVELPGKINVEMPDFSQENNELVYAPRDFSIEMRSVTARSFPENSVSAQSELFKNRSALVLYRLSERHEVGLEGGREQFAQEYGKMINGREWGVRQNPLYWYGGAAYRFSLADAGLFGFQNVFVPFAQVFAGGAQAGFLGKSQIGFKIVPESRVAFVLAAEGSVLLYGVDGNLNSTGKLGLTYGVNVSF